MNRKHGHFKKCFQVIKQIYLIYESWMVIAITKISLGGLQSTEFDRICIKFDEKPEISWEAIVAT